MGHICLLQEVTKWLRDHLHFLHQLKKTPQNIYVSVCPCQNVFHHLCISICNGYKLISLMGKKMIKSCKRTELTALITRTHIHTHTHTHTHTHPVCAGSNNLNLCFNQRAHRALGRVSAGLHNHLNSIHNLTYDSFCSVNNRI